MSPFKTAFFGFCLISLMALGACGTARGVGQDLEAAGRAVQNVVD